MKCPKCGYNSFEYLDACKKCNSDLAAYKQTHGIQPIVLPSAQFSSPTQAAVEETPHGEGPGGAETFSWESAPAEEFEIAAPAPAAPRAASETFGEFSFDDMVEPTGASTPAATQTAQDDGMADFLEHGDSSAGEFGREWETAAGSGPDAASEAVSPAGGDFELDDIFKREETAPAAAAKAPQPKPKESGGDLFNSDEFAALFQEPEEKK